MLSHIRVVPLAAESLGVRSMCTYLETSDVKILLDAGVSLCPNRFGLPPHPEEFKAILQSRRRIAEAADKAEIVTISHYHFDHHTPSYEDWLVNWTERTETAKQIYTGKCALVKSPRENINPSQRHRGWIFEKTGGKYAQKLEFADGRAFVVGETEIRFSPAVSHGSDDSGLGWLLMTTIEHRGERFMFASDVQGPMSTSTLKIIERSRPQLLMIGGPPSYLSGSKVEEKQIQVALSNLQRLVQTVPSVILEHHLLRDEHWHKKTKSILGAAREAGHRVITAASFLERQDALLEARRKELFLREPPSAEFQSWMRKSDEAKKALRPPI